MSEKRNEYKVPKVDRTRKRRGTTNKQLFGITINASRTIFILLSLEAQISNMTLKLQNLHQAFLEHHTTSVCRLYNMSVTFQHEVMHSVTVLTNEIVIQKYQVCILYHQPHRNFHVSRTIRVKNGIKLKEKRK